MPHPSRCRMRHAMVAQLRAPPVGFDEAVGLHFKLQRARVLRQCWQWTLQAARLCMHSMRPHAPLAPSPALSLQPQSLRIRTPLALHAPYCRHSPSHIAPPTASTASKNLTPHLRTAGTARPPTSRSSPL
eukprot:1165027-Prymnesium_polylepis.1